MLDVRCGQCRQRHSHAYTVIRTQGRAFGVHPVALNNGLYRIVHEVNGAVGIFLAHHILVRLQDNSRMILISRCGRHAHHYVHCLVGYTLYAMCGSKILQPTADSLLVLRRTGNLIDLGEDIKYFFGFDGCHTYVVFISAKHG